MFIHIKPEETETVGHIPRALLFPAPGLPEGHVLMGYTDEGLCPMFVNGECSIYEHRPQTCRSYDCRVFAATGVPVDESQTEIADRVRAWAFSYKGEGERAEHGTVMQAAAFLQRSRDLSPKGSIPAYPVQLAALAVKIYKLFSDLGEKSGEDTPAKSDAAIAQAIVKALSKPATSRR
ncbi:MAG TPA: hypothetical protein VG273_02160 [Bryobacteraceae bacterium]|jgi:hypothetical protein|nr:hypothetical protein [Bryobacteraceae bacterium]